MISLKFDSNNDRIYVQNPVAMNNQYLTAKNFVNGLKGMLLRGPSG